jgi:tetratricopeptide (TPR) repeat protein/transcriptional regulator with XRE-family HTH domain
MLLRRYRRAAGFTQEELAERAGLSPEGISALERGVNRAPRRDTVELLADALALPQRDRTVLENAARRRPDAQESPTDAAASAGAARALPPLVGRAREQAAIDRHLAAAGPPVLLFAGEPGVGKTRLLQEAERRAGEAGWVVLMGGCQRRTGQTPYAPVLGALEQHLQSTAPVQRKADLQGCAWLVRLLPELTEIVDPPSSSWPLPPEQERRLTFEAVGRYLRNVAGPAGTLLVLDDLQWSDADALDLLAVLIHASGRGDLRVVGAYTDTELRLDDPLTPALADLARDGLIQHHRIGPLDAGDSRTLADASMGRDRGQVEVTDELLRRTGGIPFFIVSCVQALRAGAIAEVPADDVPWDAAQSVRQRVSALPGAARDLLDIAAVAGPRVPLWLLLSAAGGDAHDGRGDDAIARALESACRARLLAEDGESGYVFAHGLIRDVIAADLSAARRAGLHRRIAELLERSASEAPVEQLAYHYARSGDVEKAIAYLERAGDHAADMGAYTAAEGYYRDLVRRLDAMDRRMLACPVRRKLGATLCTLARYAEALEVFEQVAETYRRAGDWEQEGQVTALIGQTHADQGTAQEGIVRLSSLLDSLDAQRFSSSTGGLLQDTLAQLYHLAGDYSQQLAAAEQAAELAQAAHDARLLAKVRMRTGNALRMLGQLDAASAMMEEAIATSESAGDQQTLAYALENVSVVYLLRGELARASRYVERALALVERAGDPLSLQLMVMRRGLNKFGTGDWTQSRRDFERAAALTAQTGTSWVSAYTALGLGLLDVVQGQRASGMAHLEEAIALAQRSGDLQAVRWAQTAVAEAELLDGQARSARERLEPLLDRPGQQEGLVTYLMPYLAWAHLELGDAARAEDIVTACTERATSENIRLALVDALRVRALLALRQGQVAAAATVLDEGLALTAWMDYPHGRAKVLCMYGMVEVQRGDPVRAHERYEGALAILRPLGEQLYAARCERALAELSP